MLVEHEDARARTSIDAFVRVLVGGGSAVVRPREAYDGWCRVLPQLRSMTASPLLVTDLQDVVDEVAAEPAAPAAGDLIAFHTSGSTGSPTCVVYDAERVRAHATMVAGVLELHGGSTYLALPPCRFAYGLSIVTSHALAGVPVAFLDPATDAARLRDVLTATAGPVQLYALPQQLTQLLGALPADVDLRRVVVAGGKLTARAATELARAHPGIELVNMYGQAELGPRLSTWRGPAETFTEGTIGRPVPGVQMALGEPDEHGRRPLLAGSEYAARQVIRAPYDAVEARPGGDRLVITGDLAATTPEGFVFRGRVGSFANVAGTRVDLAELTALAERLLPVVAARAHTRTSRVSGDDVLVLQLVPAAGESVEPVTVRRVLHSVLGSLVALVEVRVVPRLDVGESGK